MRESLERAREFDPPPELFSSFGALRLWVRQRLSPDVTMQFLDNVVGDLWGLPRAARKRAALADAGASLAVTLRRIVAEIEADPPAASDSLRALADEAADLLAGLDRA